MWEINLAEQTLSFLLSLLLGVILCLKYDIFRAYRKIKKPTVIGVFIQDVLYFLICAVLTFLLMIITTSGQVRGYIFIGIVIGFAICRISLSVLFFKILVVLFGAVAKIFMAVKRKTTVLIKAIFRKIQGIAKKLLKFFKNVLFYRKKLLHTNNDIVYNDHDLS